MRKTLAKRMTACANKSVTSLAFLLALRRLSSWKQWSCRWKCSLPACSEKVVVWMRPELVDRKKEVSLKKVQMTQSLTYQLDFSTAFAPDGVGGKWRGVRQASDVLIQQWHQFWFSLSFSSSLAKCCHLHNKTATFRHWKKLLNVTFWWGRVLPPKAIESAEYTEVRLFLLPKLAV